MSDVTRLLSAVDQGDPSAAEQLLPLVYAELRSLAAAKLAREKPGQTLQPTALVHEAYLRLVTSCKTGCEKEEESVHWDNRGHFFAAAAEAMRRILVEQARRRITQKRGGRAKRVELQEVAIRVSLDQENLLALNDALDALEKADPMAANLVKLRFFAGLKMTEVAQALDISLRSAHNVWAYARSWLRREMKSP